MKKRTLWIVALVGLLALGIAGQALAAEVAEAVRTRFSCGEATDPITVQGTVSEQSWNQFVLQAGDLTYTVRTGPYKLGGNLPDLNGQTVTVEGYVGPGANCNAEQAADVIRAKSITHSGGTIDLTQVPAGGFGQWRKGNCNGECTREGDGNGSQVRGGNAGGRGNGRGNGGTGKGGNCPR